jgi:quercetin dioxygenase-like cupin family protein
MTGPRTTARLGRSALTNACWYRDQLVVLLVIGEETDGQFSLLKVRGAQGAEESPHYHTHEEETIYLLEGDLTVLAGEEELRIGPGEVVSIPRGLRHAVRSDSREVAYLLQYNPAGFEHFFHELSDPAEYLSLPPQPTTPDPTQVAAAAARHGCVFLDSTADLARRS